MSRDALKYIPVNLVIIATSFATVMLLTRLLTPAEFGRYALVITICHFFHMAFFTWLEAAMARFYVKAADEDALKDHNKTLYQTALIFCLIALPVALVVLAFLPIEPQMKTLLTIGIISTFLHLFYNLGMEGHKAGQRIGRYSSVHSGQLLLSFTIGIGLIVFTPIREAAPFWGMMIGAIVVLLIELPRILKSQSQGRLDNQRLKSYFIFGSPICFSLVLAYALENGDLFFIKYFMNDAAVGAYSAGYNLTSRSFDFIFVWLSMAAMPVAISAFEKMDKTEAVGTMREFCNSLIMITLPAAIGIGLVADQAVIVLGESVRPEARLIMPWIAFAALLNGFINYYVHQAFVLAKKLHWMAYLMTVPVFINFGLNTYFIPKYGILGAVIATLSAYALAAILTVIVARRIFALPLPIITTLKCAVGCIVMALTVHYLPLRDTWPELVILMIKALVGIITYGTVIYSLNTGHIRDILRLNRRSQSS